MAELSTADSDGSAGIRAVDRNLRQLATASDYAPARINGSRVNPHPLSEVVSVNVSMI